MMLNPNKMLSLPERWLRRIDLGVGAVSLGTGMATHEWPWFLWAAIAWTLYVTNGTARMQRAMRATAARVALTLALRA